MSTTGDTLEPIKRIKSIENRFKAAPHVIELGKGAHDPTDKVHFTGDAPATADRLISIWLTNRTGHDMVLKDLEHGSGSLWAKVPPKSIPNGQAGHFQVNSVAPGNDACGHVVYTFGDVQAGGRDPGPASAGTAGSHVEDSKSMSMGFLHYQFKDPWHGTNAYYTSISDGYATRVEGVPKPTSTWSAPNFPNSL